MKTIPKAMLAITLLTPLAACAQENSKPGVGIHLAALQGNVEAIRKHVEAGSDLNEKDAYGSTPLIIAATFGKTEVAKVLIDAGADVNVTNNDGGTALHAAAFLCRPEIVSLLLENGADTDVRDGFGNTPLEAVSAPFDDVKGVYDSFAASLGPLGLELDYEQIRTTRPKIAEMLKTGDGRGETGDG
jgi:hypothetical protein